MVTSVARSKQPNMNDVRIWAAERVLIFDCTIRGNSEKATAAKARLGAVVKTGPSRTARFAQPIRPASGDRASKKTTTRRVLSPSVATRAPSGKKTHHWMIAETVQLLAFINVSCKA
mmetsp:Transcript_53433/g.134517  ORF Transcript_53433/g.134517 Transcript_53433/m.134517 type:complete len:117 (+) Transcript_53433:926-1276(+)